jgi:trk system potassium uptake protein TrkA
VRRYVVIGLGNFGSSVAETLSARGQEVIAVDQDGAAVDRIAPLVAKAVVGNGTDVHLLERLGVRNADAGVISTGDDITASILSAMGLHDLNVAEVFVKVVSRDHARVMERIGVTETVFPERDSAISLGTRICGTAVFNYVRLSDGFSVQEIAVPQSWQGKTLRELALRQNYDITVVALKDVLTNRITPTPNPDMKLKESDTLLVAGNDKALEKTASLK